MKRANYLYTIERNNIKSTILVENCNPILFLLTEQQIGNNTVILFIFEITNEEYQYHKYLQ